MGASEEYRRERYDWLKKRIRRFQQLIDGLHAEMNALDNDHVSPLGKLEQQAYSSKLGSITWDMLGAQVILKDVVKRLEDWDQAESARKQEKP